MTRHVRWVARVFVLGTVAIMVVATYAGAQSSLFFFGSAIRHVADTIWTETDSETDRTVFHGDTISERQMKNDRLLWEGDFLVLGVSSRVLAARDSTGSPPAGASIGSLRPTSTLLNSRVSLQQALRQVALADQAAALGLTPSETGVPEAPQPTTYAVSGITMSGIVTIVQHGDTARYIRGGGPRADTTVFLFTGVDSVKRLSPSPVRTFGPGMVATLANDMRGALRRADPSPAAQALQAAYAPPTTPTTLFLPTGGLMRAHGDTIWEERDSSATMTVFRGDTVTTRTFLNDVERNVRAIVIVDRGDSARVLRDENAGGQQARGVGRTIPYFPRADAKARFQSAQNNQALMSRMPTAPPEPPFAPPTPVTYAISPGVRIVQHQDTAMYIRGCAPLTPLDTTVFVFFGADSVRRASPAPPRLFGPPMASVLIGNMRAAMTRDAGNARNANIDNQLPPLPHCAR